MKKTMMILLALSLACIVAVGSTMSYLTYTDADVNTMVVGNVKISQLEQKRENGALVDFVDDVKLLPVTDVTANSFEINGKEYQLLNTEYNAVDKIVTVKNEGTEDAYVRTLIAFEMLKGEDDTWKNPLTDGNLKMNAPNVTETGVTFEKNGTWYALYVCTYSAPLTSGQTTAPSLLQVYLSSKEKGEFYEGVGEKYDILTLSQAVQAAGFTAGAEAALNEAFGAIDAANAATWFGGIGA